MLIRFYKLALTAGTFTLGLSLLLLGAPASGAPASGQDKASPEVIPLIAVDSYATTALWTHVFVEYFIPEVDRRLAETGNYQIRWNKAFGGTIAKTRGVLDSLQYDLADIGICLLYTSPSPRDQRGSRMPSSA